MSGTPKDIDPATELVEEDEEQSLPETEQAIDLATAAGPLAAGRAVIMRHAKTAPPGPGVYRMIDRNGDVLYVGKAKSIRKRILSYTRPTGYDPRIERMIAATAALEFVSTSTETEALLLEANLIKRLRPRFNVLLRDDKSFPYILITGDHWAPQILKHRGARKGEGRYYGPFASVWAVNRTITALQRAFLLRSCTDAFFESRTRPCLLYQIKRCSGPCTREIEFAAYRELVREANDFLSGKSRKVKEELAAEMEKASAALDFERAAIYRDRLAALSAVQAHQGINPRGVEEADVFALHQEGGFFCVQVFFFRTGQNWGNRAYFPKADRSLDAGEVMGAFLAQFYDDKPPPRLVLVSHAFPECELLAQALSAKSGRRIEVTHPTRGEKKELVDHALANAREALGRKLADTSSQRKLLAALAECFGLPRPPRRIEVYDNSHIQGTNAVGAMIVAGPEGFRKNQYRKFNIRSAELTPGDDFAMMREVLERRFKRLMAEAPRAPVALNGSADERLAPVPSPTEPGPARVPHDTAQVGQARLAMGEGGEDRRSEAGEGPPMSTHADDSHEANPTPRPR
jgi:excinuclease ABC subunit C